MQQDEVEGYDVEALATTRRSGLHRSSQGVYIL
jgi:hypothetical protein